MALRTALPGPSRPASRPGQAPARLLLLCLALWLATPLEAQRWRPQDRVLLTSFHLVSGLARDERHLYAATAGGLQILDLVSEEWQLPSTVEDGFPAHEQPSAVAVDPLQRTVWLATLEGSLYSYQVDLQRWTPEASPAVGPILRMAWFQEDAREGLYLRSPQGWFRMPRSSLAAEPVPVGELPASVRSLELNPEERLARADPAFAGARGTLLMDEHARRWPMTDFAPALRQGLYWLATAGDDLYLYDSRFVSVDPHRYGLLNPSARSLAADADGGIWFGGDGRGPRRGVTRAGADLQDWRWFEAGVEGAPAREIRDIVVTGDTLWFATPDGVHRLEPATGRWSRMGGAAARVNAHRLAAGAGGSVWAATDRGVLRIAGGAPAVELAAGPSLTTILVAGDTLWVGGDGGVRRFMVSGEELAWGSAEARPTGRVADLARTAEGIWLATRDGALWRFAAGEWSGPFREASQGGVDGILRLRTRGDVLWAGGEGGAARRDPDSGQWRFFLTGRDLPGAPVWDLLATEDHVYVALPQGVMRLEWREAF